MSVVESKPSAVSDTAGRLHEQLQRWVRRLAGHGPRVVLADGDDPRIVTAAEWLMANTPVRPMLIGTRSGPATVPVSDRADLMADADIALALRQAPDPSDPVYLAAALVALGRADACVAGAARPTADVIRAGLAVIGLRSSESILSSCFLMLLSDGRELAYGDCAVLPEPDASQLAQVAVSTARTFHQLTGREPCVAMLSFSTKGSADHASVELVRKATGQVRDLDPGLRIDGELQFDAAVVEPIGRSKAAGSVVAGHANVLIFPNLAAGNIGYKITERLAGATAIGPILQGLAAPMNDLSRGCSARDVIAASLLSAIQWKDGNDQLDGLVNQ